MKSFLQTKDWGEFQQAFGRKIFWLEDKLVVKFDLPLGKSWLYCARAQIITNNQDTITKDMEDFYKKLAKIAKEENAIFAKIEPDINSKFKFKIFNEIKNSNVLNINNLNIDLKLKIKNLKLFTSNCLQPQDELLLDITSSEVKILAQMHPKTRYNIRLAEKKGLEIITSIDPKDINDFYNLANRTSQRKGFKYHSRYYYEKMLQTLKNGEEIQLKLLTAYHEHKPISSLILLIYEDQAYYLHGASDDNYRHLMSTFLLQWEAIKKAKKLGRKWYNFGGISPIGQTPIINNQAPNKSQISNHKSQNENLDIKNSLKIKNLKLKIDQAHAWSGITRFKLGFAPLENPANRVLHYPDCYDIVYQLGMYRIYKLIKKFK